MQNSAPFLAALFLVTAIPRLALSGELKSEQGFSLTYPDGWRIANRGERDMANRMAESILKKPGLPGRTAMNTIISNPSGRKFSDNINIVVVPNTPVINDESVQQALEELKKGFQLAGWRVQSIKGECAAFAGKKAISLRSTVKMPVATDPITQWQVAFPGRTKTYIITCSSLASGFRKMEPLYQTAVDSFQYPPDQTPLDDAQQKNKPIAQWLANDPIGEWFADVPTETLAIGIGVALGCGVLFWVFMVVARPAAAPQETFLPQESSPPRETFSPDEQYPPDEPFPPDSSQPPGYR